MLGKHENYLCAVGLFQVLKNLADSLRHTKGKNSYCYIIHMFYMLSLDSAIHDLIICYCKLSVTCLHF